MADVMARSQETRTPLMTSPVAVDVSDDDDVYELMTLAELKDELDNHTDFDERAKIRKAIRVIKNKKLSSQKQDLAKHNQPKPTPSPKTTEPEETPVEEKTPQATSNTKPWLGERKNTSFRSVSTKRFTPVVKNKFELIPNSAPAKFSSTLGEKKADASPLSRFDRREYSSSFRAKPSNKVTDHVINRSVSLKFKPKQNADILHARSVTTPPLILESVVQENIVVDSATTRSPIIQRKASNTSVEIDEPKTTQIHLEVNPNISDSPKETEIAPSIPVVPGNKRRSRGILGRVLSFKIDSEKVASPQRVRIQPKVEKVLEASENPEFSDQEKTSEPLRQITGEFEPEVLFEEENNSDSELTKSVDEFVERLIEAVVEKINNSNLTSTQTQEETAQPEFREIVEKRTGLKLEILNDSESQSESGDESRDLSDQSQSEDDAMESRRNRYGNSAGSVRSRILATEDPNSTKKALDVEKLKKQRQTADARMFKRSEGVQSRMNRFTDKAENEGPKPRVTGPKTRVTDKAENEGPKARVTGPKTRVTDKAENEGPKARVTGRSKYNVENDRSSRYRRREEPVVSTLERKKRFEINNNDVTAPAKATLPKQPSASEEALAKLEAASKSIIADMTSQDTRSADENDVIISKIETNSTGLVVEFNVNGNGEISSSPSELSSPLDDAAESIKSELSSPLDDATESIKSELNSPLDDATESTKSGVQGDGEKIEISENDVTGGTDVADETKLDDVIDRILNNEIAPTEMKSETESVPVPSEVTTNECDVTEEKRPRTRRQRRSDRLSASKAPDADVTMEKEKSSDVSQSEAAKSDHVTERRRRRRRARREESDIVTSSSTSAASTPDKETNGIVESKATDAAQVDDVTAVSKNDDDVTAAGKNDDDVTSVGKNDDDVTAAGKNDDDVTGVGKNDDDVTGVGKNDDDVTKAPEVTAKPKNEDATSNESQPLSASPVTSPVTIEETMPTIESCDVIKNSRAVIEGSSEVESAKQEAINEQGTEDKVIIVVTDVTEVDATKTEKDSEKDKTVEKDIKEQVLDPKLEMRNLMDNLSDVTDEQVLDKLLHEAEEYEDRKKIRAALRELRRKYREGLSIPKKDESLNWKSSKTTTGVAGSNPGKYGSVTKTTTSEIKSKGGLKPSSASSKKINSPLDGIKPMEITPQVARTLAEKYSISPSLLRKEKMSSSGTKKIGSIFDREEEAPKKSGSKLELERRQAERRRDLTRNRSMPASSSKDARKMFVAKLEGNTGGNKGAAKKVGRSPTFVVPNANNVKQMLLKWCQAKTRSYENVEINNFSGSWANGMAFCALVHNFFPESFDFSTLEPNNRESNFELAFSTAERLADADQLLEVGDMILMGNRPDSKCVFTYVQSLYNKLRKFEKPLKPLSPIKPVVKVMEEISEVSANSTPPYSDL